MITKKDPAPLPEAADPDPDSSQVMILSVKIPSRRPLPADMMSGSEAITFTGLMARLIPVRSQRTIKDVNKSHFHIDPESSLFR